MWGQRARVNRTERVIVNDTEEEEVMAPSNNINPYTDLKRKYEDVSDAVGYSATALLLLDLEVLCVCQELPDHHGPSRGLGSGMVDHPNNPIVLSIRCWQRDWAMCG